MHDGAVRKATPPDEPDAEDELRVVSLLMQECVRRRAAWREALQQLLERAAELEAAEAAVLEAARRRDRRERPEQPGLRALMENFERRLIEWALTLADGQQNRAALALGLRATTLNEKMKRLRIRWNGAGGE